MNEEEDDIVKFLFAIRVRNVRQHRENTLQTLFELVGVRVLRNETHTVRHVDVLAETEFLANVEVVLYGLDLLLIELVFVDEVVREFHQMMLERMHLVLRGVNAVLDFVVEVIGHHVVSVARLVGDRGRVVPNCRRRGRFLVTDFDSRWEANCRCEVVHFQCLRVFERVTVDDL